MVKVLVLEGGTSDERPISLRSAEAVVRSLKRLGHKVLRYDTAEGLDGVAAFKGKVDIVFPILHGKDGEDGVVQAKLESLGMKYLGSDVAASRLCMDKAAFRQAAADFDVLVPEGEVVSLQTVKESKFILSPYVLKPIDGGSSIDTYIIRDPAVQTVDFDDIFSRHDQMLLEELIEGIEITVPVLDKTALPVIEIIPPLNEEFDYTNKYNSRTQEICPPKSISANLQAEAQRLSEKVHNSLNARHLSRIDIIVSGNKLYVLEINTIPGLTSASLFPLAAKTAGMDMDALVQKFVSLALDS